MNRPLVIALAVLMGWFHQTERASAQVVQTDPAGYPLREWAIALDGNTDYTFTTDSALVGTALQPVVAGSTLVPDSVLSVREGLFSEVASAGSDGCGASIGPSCFTFRTVGTTGSSVLAIVMLRAYRQTNPGRTNIYYKRVSDTGWTQLTASPVTFGGATYTINLLPGQGRLRFDTLMAPGGNTSHRIWLADSTEWRTRLLRTRNGAIGNLASLDWAPSATPGTTGNMRIVFGGDTGTGAIRLARNDFFGNDGDGDGLSTPFEISLGTCDLTTTPLPSFNCALLPGCSAVPGPRNAVCQYSLEDTDHDGLTDYQETYGVDDPSLWLPLWGSNPAHMDVFVEVDLLDQVDITPGAIDSTCEAWTTLAAISGPPSSTLSFAAMYADAMNDMPGYLNPDGLPGVSSHLDLGLTNPDLTDTTYGNYGGGRSCVIQDGRIAQCPGWQNYYNASPSVCAVNGVTPAISPTRRNFFFWSLDAVTRGGGQGGGTGYFADDISTHIHELGHDMWLQHSGPTGSTAERSNDNGNYRPNYPSRMNYRYQDVGGYDGSLPSWTGFSYSSGTLSSRPLSMRSGDLVERCPLGPGLNPGFLSAPRPSSPGGSVTSSFLQVFASNVVPSTTAGCAGGFDVDWNEDWFGTPEWIASGGPFPGTAAGGPPSTPSYDRVYAESRRDNRYSEIGVARTPRAAPDLTVASDVLLFATLEPFASSVGTSWRVELRGDGNADCNEIPVGLRDPAYVGTAHPEFVTSFSYPGCMRPGSPVRPLGSTAVDGVAVAGAPVSTGGTSTTPGVHLVTNQAGTIGWAALAITRAAATAQEFTWSGVTSTTFPAWPAASTNLGRREPDLVRLPATGETLLAYVGTSGQVRLAGLPPASSSWSANVPATDASGGAAITSTRAPSLVEITGQIFMATTNVANLVQIWRLGGTNATPIQARTWTLQFFPVTQSSTTRPTLSAMLNRDDSTGSTWRLGVTYTDSANSLWWWVTPPRDRWRDVQLQRLWGGRPAALGWNQRRCHPVRPCHDLG